MDYFFDSSAIIEIINSPEKDILFKDKTIVTNALNIAEVHNFFLRNHNEQTADHWISHLDFCIMSISVDIAIRASKFKHKHKKDNFSYADCIGYITAIENNIVFLTKDNKFKGKENVKLLD